MAVFIIGVGLFIILYSVLVNLIREKSNFRKRDKYLLGLLALIISILLAIISLYIFALISALLSLELDPDMPGLGALMVMFFMMIVNIGFSSVLTHIYIKYSTMKLRVFATMIYMVLSTVVQIILSIYAES